MDVSLFHTPDGHDIPAVTAAEMRDVDRVAVEEVGVVLLQMMENAGRILAWHVRDVRDRDEPVVVVAGTGGNGGGGMTCARHLANRNIPVQVLLDRAPEELDGAAAHQEHILQEMDVPIHTDLDALAPSEEDTIVVDALIGYGLRGEVRAPGDRYIEWTNNRDGPVVSLDVPSGIDATSGETHGLSVTPDRTVTLALPKTGLDTLHGDLYVADISIPETVYERLDIEYTRPFGPSDWVRLEA